MWFWGGLATAAWKKGDWLLERLVGVGGHGLRVRRLGGTRAGEIGLTRFLRNPAVTVEAMVAEASRRTAERCAGRRVLVIQDTTVARAAERRGQGLFLHAALVVDALLVLEGRMTGAGLALTPVAQQEAGVGQAQNRPLVLVEPLHWRLLTTLPAGDAAEAFAVVGLYRRRWAIEQLFRTLKSAGFDISAVEIEDAAARRRLTMAALVAAMTVQQLVHARDGTQGPAPLRPLTDAFEAADLPLLKAFTAKLEGKTQRQKNPHPEARWPTPAGSAPGSAAGPATTESPVPPSCSQAGCTYRPQRTASPLWPNTMCESGRPQAKTGMTAGGGFA
jgi:hypothetical protein